MRRISAVLVGLVLVMLAVAPVDAIRHGRGPKPHPSPTPALTASPTSAPTPTPVPTPTPSATPSPTTTAVPTPSPAPSPTASAVPPPSPSATPSPTATPVPTPTIAPTGLSMYAPIYGTGLEMDSKDNFQVGWTGKARIDYRFRSSGGAVKSIAANVRGGSGYSGGNGGQLRVAIQADANGQPSGTDLASVTWSPGNPSGGWEDKAAHAFTSQPVLARGVVYHLVFSNPSATQTTDYVSLNTTTVISGGSLNPMQPAFSDDFAFFYNTGSGWTRTVSQHSSNITPVFDLAYTDGTHDGTDYFQATVDYYAPVGGSAQVRQTMTPARSVSVTSAFVRLKRTAGTGPLTITLEQSGTVLATGTVDGTGIPLSSAPIALSDGVHWDEASLSGGRWVGFTFPRVTLAVGTAYDLRVSAPSGSTYLAMPIREVSNEVSPTWGARAFRDGEAQKSSGSGWAPFYEFAPHDMQFYLGGAQ